MHAAFLQDGQLLEWCEEKLQEHSRVTSSSTWRICLRFGTGIYPHVDRRS